MRSVSGLGAAWVVFSGQALAADYCSLPPGSPLAPKTFQQIIAGLPTTAAPKSEFETTADYQARIAAAAQSERQVLLARPVDEQTFPAPLEYDADRGLLKVRTTAFDWGTANWSVERILGKPKLTTDGIFDVATVLHRTITPLGEYKGSNVYGASALIAKQSRRTDSVWVRAGDNPNDKIFKGDADQVVGVIPMAPNVAKLVKPSIRFALAVTPKPPFIVTGNGPGNAPSFDDPRDIPLSQDHFRILIADVDCGIVLDHENKVLGIFRANQPVARPKPAVATSLTITEVAPTASSDRKIWLELGRGSDVGALSREFGRLKSRDPDLFQGINGYAANTSDGTRLLIGPFHATTDAEAFAEALQGAGIDTSQWISSGSLRITRVGPP